MGPGKSHSREAMVHSAAALLREHGAGGTTIDRVLAHSGAPRGSVYHHFPQGRAQLLDEAVTSAGEFITALIEQAVHSRDPVKAIDDFFALWRQQLLDSDFRAGCPVVAVAVETNDDAPQPARSAAAVFARWQQALAAMFASHGLPEARSKRLAAFVIAAVEGAVVLCRAERSTAPLQAAGEEIHDLLTHVLHSHRTNGEGPAGP